MKKLSALLLVITISITLGNAKLMAQPGNDLIENATDLGYGPIPYEESEVDFSNATNTNDHTPALGCALSQAGVWYKFTATIAGSVGAGILLPDSPVIVFFEGPSEGVTSGMQLEYVDQPSNTCGVGSTSSITTTSGTTYYIYFKNNVDSDILINTTNVFQVPENDLIENAISMNEETMPYVEENIHFLMATNTDDGGQADCTSGNFSGIWYKVTPNQDGQISAQMSSADSDSILIIYESNDPDATSGTQLTWVDQELNPCGLGNYAIVDAEVGKTYYFFALSADAYADLNIDTSLALSTSQNDFIDFNFYPNPVIDQLNFNAATTIDNFKIYNLLGQVVVAEKINNTSGSIDIRHLTNGMYLAEITSGGIKKTVKILKK